jgi:signal transduction histidine kinase
MNLQSALSLNRLLPAKVPFRLRFFFRTTFLLLAFATLGLALAVLQNEKERSYKNYRESLFKNQAQIAARLRHPTGQLALLNPSAFNGVATPLRPLALPFSAIDFDDRNKAQQAVEMAGCLIQYADGANLCAGVGSNPFAGGFIYLVGSFDSRDLVSRVSGQLDLSLAHRAIISVELRGNTQRWIAPFEAAPPAGVGSTLMPVNGRLVGFQDNGPITAASRPARDFRGWLWQDSRCSAAMVAKGVAAPVDGCSKRAFVSIRLPIDLFREALFQKTPNALVWPPADLDLIKVRLQWLAPDAGAPLFDSNSQGTAAFSWLELSSLLSPGEKLSVRKIPPGGTRAPYAGTEIVALSGAESEEPLSPLIGQVIRRLEVDGFDAPITRSDIISTPLGQHELTLTGDIRTANKTLTAVATRLSWFVGAMLLAIFVTWLVIEVSIIRRITELTRRAASVSKGVKSATGQSQLAALDLADLRGGDELGVLAGGLQDLLQRVHEDVRREQIRVAQEKDTWHAVGHEIMSPLQSLMVLHGDPADPAQRYISRMQQAVRVLYGSASPSEAFESTALTVQALDVNEFLTHVADNAAGVGLPDVAYNSVGATVRVLADEYSLEDVIYHVLRNAQRHKRLGTPVTLSLNIRTDLGPTPLAVIQIHNQGDAIDEAMLEKIFEYGVSDQSNAAALGQRGQGLFVAKTYMAKMGGTITAHNAADGAYFELRLLCAGPQALK